LNQAEKTGRLIESGNFQSKKVIISCAISVDFDTLLSCAAKVACQFFNTHTFSFAAHSDFVEPCPFAFQVVAVQCVHTAHSTPHHFNHHALHHEPWQWAGEGLFWFSLKCVRAKRKCACSAATGHFWCTRQ
jgi:hypothetical protein